MASKFLPVMLVAALLGGGTLAGCQSTPPAEPAKAAPASAEMDALKKDIATLKAENDRLRKDLDAANAKKAKATKGAKKAMKK